MIKSENQKSQDILSFEIANKTIELKKELIDVQMESIWSFSLTRDNLYLVVGGYNQEQQIYIYQDNRPFQILKKVYVSRDLVYDVQFSSNDQFLCVGCQSQHILIWTFNHLLKYDKPHPQQIIIMFRDKPQFQFTPDENYLCFQDSTKIQFWNIDDEMIWKNIKMDNNFKNFTIKMKTVYSLGKSNLIQINYVPNTKILKRILVNQEQNKQIDVCENKFLIINASVSKIYIINIQSGKIIRTFKTSNKVVKVTLLNDTQHFSCATKSFHRNQLVCIQIIDIPTFKILLKYSTHYPSQAHLFQFKPLQFFIANDNQIEVWKPIE